MIIKESVKKCTEFILFNQRESEIHLCKIQCTFHFSENQVQVIFPLSDQLSKNIFSCMICFEFILCNLSVSEIHLYKIQCPNTPYFCKSTSGRFPYICNLMVFRVDLYLFGAMVMQNAFRKHEMPRKA